MKKPKFDDHDDIEATEDVVDADVVATQPDAATPTFSDVMGCLQKFLSTHLPLVTDVANI